MPELSTTFNVYCDESCHLEADPHRFMVLGAVWCPVGKSREIAERIREIKENHGLPRDHEMKWGKISPAKATFYRDIVDYFFDDDDLHFRGFIASKEGLRHEDFDQSHDDWYYKMYYHTLHNIFKPQCSYRIYFDIKDTRSGAKYRRLHEVLCNTFYDRKREVVQRVQALHSQHVEQIQLADVLIGAVGYANRSMAGGQVGSQTKQFLVDRIRRRSGYTLLKPTFLKEEKFNLFHWNPRAEAPQG
jgi:Protein of unknown function (DUF3800)